MTEHDWDFMKRYALEHAGHDGVSIGIRMLIKKEKKKKANLVYRDRMKIRRAIADIGFDDE